MSEQRRPRCSIYEQYVQRGPARTSVVRDGRVCEIDANGELRPLPPCCDDPWACRKPGCWTKLGVVLPDR